MEPVKILSWGLQHGCCEAFILLTKSCEKAEKPFLCLKLVFLLLQS